ncbi:hypothetical protein [Halomicrobium salinisoli]|uniref:hypothetical protein n=1 Tax=Halomicrobium salinisoli TaxID=2878391 RepID=UPI001CF0B04C|nr:hypothetical protein [Halomicrobium salinisoli]
MSRNSGIGLLDAVRQPRGVKALVAVGFAASIGGLGWGLVSLGTAPLLGLGAIALSLAHLVVLLGLWAMEAWARTAAMALYALLAVAGSLREAVLPVAALVVAVAYLAVVFRRFS